MSDGTVKGVVHVIEPTKTFGQNGFRKRLVVLEQDKGRFTNYIPIDFTYEGCDKVDDLSVGDEIEVTFRLSGRKWQRDPNSDVKYFLNAEAQDFNKAGAAPTSNTSAAAESDGPEYDESEAWDAGDDVPF